MNRTTGPSLRAIAEKAGVHQSTVSRVLKNDPRISRETARRVRKAADALGYSPDPHLGKLMAHMRSMRSARFESTLGFLRSDQPYPDMFSEQLLLGARNRAEALGYRVDDFPVDYSAKAIRSVNRILHARNIEGLLILPTLGEPPPVPPLNVEHLAVVNTATFSTPFPAHDIFPDHTYNMALVIKALKKSRAKKPGLISWPGLDERQHHAGPMAFFEYCITQLRKPPVPPFNWSGSPKEIETGFRKWYREHRPDLLILPNLLIHAAVHRILQNLVPGRTPCLGSSQPGEGLPGVDQCPYDIGRAAIDMLTAHVQRNEYGKPGVIKHMRIPGVWVP